jgi:uncharacterized membrane protein
MTFLIVPALLVLMVTASAAQNWNFIVPAKEVRPTGGVVQFPVSAFEDGSAKHFVYKHSPSQWIRFFIIKSGDGKVRAAFDACDVCFRARKGYVQQGPAMVCVNCGLKFRSDKINEVKGGCNPGPLRRTVKGSNLVITQRDLLSGLKYFQ